MASASNWRGRFFALFPGMSASSSEKSLLVFAAAPGRLSEFERYLVNQNWTVRIRSDFKQLLADVVAIKPKYILLSLQAQHPNLEQIRSLMEQVYHVQVVDFSEETGAEFDEQLRNLKRRTILVGALTGPNFENFLLKSRLSKVRLTQENQHRRLQEGFPALMKTLFQVQEDKKVSSLGWVSKLRAFRIHSKGVSGYFLAAVAGDRVLDDKTQLQVSAALRELCEQNGIEVESVESFPIDSRRVHFRDWVTERARFQESGAYRDHEVMMAFLEVLPQLTELHATADEKFVEIPLEEMQPDRRVPIDLHLALPLNGKYILYVAAGSALTFSQQLNLQSRKVKTLFAKFTDRNEIFRERTKRDVEQSIGEFYQNRAA